MGGVSIPVRLGPITRSVDHAGNKKCARVVRIVVVLCGFSYYQVAYHWKLQTDVLALLPDNESDSATQSLRQIASGNLGRTALFLVGHTQDSSAHAATRTLGAWLAASPLVATVQWDHSRTQHTFFDLYFPLRYRLLSPSIRQQPQHAGRAPRSWNGSSSFSTSPRHRS